MKAWGRSRNAEEKTNSPGGIIAQRRSKETVLVFSCVSQTPLKHGSDHGALRTSSNSNPRSAVPLSALPPRISGASRPSEVPSTAFLLFFCLL